MTGSAERTQWKVPIAALLLLLPLIVSALPTPMGTLRSGWSPARASGEPLGSSAAIADRARHASTPASTAWDPAYGISSPGVPHYLLGTVSRRTSQCSGGFGTPAWLAYDAADRSAWVAAPGDCVDRIPVNGSSYSVAASITVGHDPFGVAIDNATHEVFVTNTGSDNVSVISGRTDRPIASIGVGSRPYGATYDWRTGDVYVANGGSNNVSVLSGKTLAVIASVTVGRGPLGIVADPVHGQVFVADRKNNTVTAFSDSTYALRATLAVGVRPYGIALDNTTGAVFVSNEGSNNLSVIASATDSLQATIPVVAPFMDLQGIAYDAANRTVWVGAGSFYAVVVNATNLSVTGFASTDPSGVTYDWNDGKVCVTNTANFTFECFSFQFRYPTDPVTFTEHGLPAGSAWSVRINETGRATTLASSVGPNISISTVYWPNVNSGVYAYAIRGPAGYAAATPRGTLTVAGSPVVLVVPFTAAPGP
ncbi:MAG TPA: YncE family protein, partial [Thermoplasmata archaeon]|nr:YncE family protein [Thermoplasmata archaeon]